MAFVVVFDANVLFPISLCDLYITASGKRLYRAHWSATILEEVERAGDFAKVCARIQSR